MHFHSLPVVRRAWRFPHLIAVVSALILTAGCRSTPPPYVFESTASRVTTPPGAAAPQAVAEAAPPQVPLLAKVSPARRQQLKARQARKIARVAMAQVLGQATAAAPTRLSRAATAAARPRTDVARHPTEVGLGTTVLGVLGLIVFPIALIGFLLSGGGLVWGIIGAAAALAVFIAWLDPFG